MGIREIIAERLNYEFYKRNLSIDDVSKDSGISVPRLNGFLSGDIPIKLLDIRRICEVIECNFYVLISNNYHPTNVHFRNMGKESKLIALKIENAFNLIRDYLPKPYIPDIRLPDCSFSDHQELLTAVLSCVSEVKNSLGENISELFEKINIPIISVAKGADFDAFVLISEPACAICVNINSPPCRIAFSLLHELAHLLFDRDKKLGADKFAPNLFSDKISEKDKPEFIATKFAQFFLIPSEILEKWRWPPDSAGLEQIYQAILCQNTTKAVNALYDILKVKNSQAVYYNSVKLTLLNMLSGNDLTIIELLSSQKDKLYRLIHKHKSSFSDEVFAQLAEDLEIG